jgi:asparagine synthase (glutamine-hydrolysing)
LIKADKITMANSVELRVPLLDHLVLEFAASLPPDYKVKGLATKRIFKQAFASVIPEPILKRKKTGFPVPLRKWLQHDLRDYAHDILLSAPASNRGYFKRTEMEKLLKQGGDDAAPTKEIFSLLTLELWHREFMDHPGIQSGPVSRSKPVFQGSIEPIRS